MLRNLASLASAREALGLGSSSAVLHVGDLAFSVSDHVERFVLGPVAVAPGCRADDLVGRYLREARQNADPLVAPPFDLKPEYLTGLVRTASARGALPPQVPMRLTAPLGAICKQRCKRLGGAPIECFRRFAQRVDHRPSISPPGWGMAPRPGCRPGHHR
jgi:hypothetical protein